jgi:hypothetical protein
MNQKAADIIMEEKRYLSHRRRVRSVRPNRYIESIDKESEQALKYASKRLSFLDEVSERKRQELGEKNRQLLRRLLEIERREVRDSPDHEPGHWNSYFVSRSQSRRIKQDNSALLGRLIDTQAAIPKKSDLRRSFKKLAKVIKLHQNFPKVQRLHEFGREKAKAR